MPKYSNSDHYIDQQTGILKNLLNITTEEELEKAEATFVSIRSYELARNPIRGHFDFDHLKAIHHYLFQDIYAWAGECRDIDIAKDGSFFAHHSRLEIAAKTLFNELANEKYLERLDVMLFSQRAAYYLGELNALHPFREGNGRAQREFISHLAYDNGYCIAWENLTPSFMIEASIESFKKADCSKWENFIRSNIKKL